MQRCYYLHFGDSDGVLPTRDPKKAMQSFLSRARLHFGVGDATEQFHDPMGNPKANSWRFGSMIPRNITYI